LPVGYKRAMSNIRRFQLDELILRPGTYFNPQTEIMIVVDDSPEVDHEILAAEDFDAAEWVQITDEVPVDEHRRDELVESFQLTHQPGELTEEAGVLDDVDDVEEKLDPDEDPEESGGAFDED
jgi:hypothetical protein